MEHNLFKARDVQLRTSLDVRQLAAYTVRQITQFFPDDAATDRAAAEDAAQRALTRMGHCLKWINDPKICADGMGIFSHLHSDSYAMYLALFANECSRGGATDLATRAYLLNKALHAIDVYHEVALPEVFLFVHAVGTVIGRAKIGNFFCIYQNCTIGGNWDNGTLDYPELGQHLLMYSRSSLIGKCRTGDRVIVGAGTTLINKSIAGSSVATPHGIKVNASKVNEHLERFFTRARQPG